MIIQSNDITKLAKKFMKEECYNNVINENSLSNSEKIVLLTELTGQHINNEILQQYLIDSYNVYNFLNEALEIKDSNGKITYTVNEEHVETWKKEQKNLIKDLIKYSKAILSSINVKDLMVYFNTFEITENKLYKFNDFFYNTIVKKFKLDKALNAQQINDLELKLDKAIRVHDSFINSNLNGLNITMTDINKIDTYTVFIENCLDVFGYIASITINDKSQELSNVEDIGKQYPNTYIISNPILNDKMIILNKLIKESKTVLMKKIMLIKMGIKNKTEYIKGMNDETVRNPFNLQSDTAYAEPEQEDDPMGQIASQTLQQAQQQTIDSASQSITQTVLYWLNPMTYWKLLSTSLSSKSLLMTTGIGAVVIGVGIAAWYLYKYLTNKDCSRLDGQKKIDCLIKVSEKAIKKAESDKSKCENTEDPARCKKEIDELIKKWKIRKEQIKSGKEV